MDEIVKRFSQSDRHAALIINTAPDGDSPESNLLNMVLIGRSGQINQAMLRCALEELQVRADDSELVVPVFHQLDPSQPTHMSTRIVILDLETPAGLLAKMKDEFGGIDVVSDSERLPLPPFASMADPEKVFGFLRALDFTPVYNPESRTLRFSQPDSPITITYTFTECAGIIKVTPR